MAESTQWRVYITDNNGHGSFTGTTEVVMSTEVGGATACVGGIPLSSSNHNSYPTADAFNGSTSDRGWVTLSGESAPSYIGYEFAAAVQIVEFRLYGNNAAFFGVGFDPKDFELQYFDGSVWVTVSSFTDETGWSSFEERIYEGDTSGPGITNVISGRCVRGVAQLPANRELYAYQMIDGEYCGYGETDVYGNFEFTVSTDNEIFLRVVDPEGIYSTEIRENITPTTIIEE